MPTHTSGRTTGQASQRRYDVDHLRIIALLLLIFFHVGLVFTNYGWLIQSRNANIYIETVLSGLISPWRLLLVFFIGGVATRFAISRSYFSKFFKARVARLLLPFAFAVVVLVPPQGYADTATGPLSLSAYTHYLIHVAPFKFPYHGIMIPDLGHVWFLPYLFAYSIAAAGVWCAMPGLRSRLEAIVNAASFRAVLAVTTVYLMLTYAFILPLRGDSKVVFTDYEGHLQFAPLFALGFLFATNAMFWEGAKRWWKGLAGVAVAIAIFNVAFLPTAPFDPYAAFGLTFNTAQGLYSGAVLLVLLGFAYEHLNRPSPGLAYANDAILPVYLMHQTVTVLAGYEIITQGWGGVPEFTALFALSLGVPLLIYQVFVRNNRVLRVLFGLAPQLQASASQAAPRDPPACDQPETLKA